MSILEKIYEHRKAAVAAQKEIPSQRPEDYQKAYDLNLAPPLINFAERVRQSPYRLSLMAEIKRASPSKGVISLDACAPSQARTYALAGASVISVLTEPHWFKGSLEDLRAVRQALVGIPNRPAVLRKEFIFDEYQILEARLAGADTVLLIVKMLDEETLTRLYKYSQSLGMEPLVEVNTAEEMERAIKLESKVIGVNNRNLTSFEVDTGTTTRLMKSIPESTVLAALSGITGPQDVKPYLEQGVGAVLVGEALMRAKDVTQFIAELLSGDKEAVVQSDAQRKLLVKICGMRNVETVKAAIKSGADLVGIVLVAGTDHTVSAELGQQISKLVHETPKPQPSSALLNSNTKAAGKAASFYEHTVKYHLQHPERALLVGVFRDQSLDFVLQQQRLLDLDIVQLDGSEPNEWAALIPCPVIRSLKADSPELGTRGQFAIPLLNAADGGAGQNKGIQEIMKNLERDPELKIILSGDLNPDNLIKSVDTFGGLKSQIAGIDVSSGVEMGGQQNSEKIEKLIAAAKSIVLS